MRHGIFRVEASSWNRKFELLGIRFTFKSAEELAKLNDNNFVRILDCKNNRKCVYRNYEWKDLTWF